ncbi:hypothetical protein BX616_006984 [Lobosporangium transversale]|uniref:DUF4238 domain-containing protein n=1 Tax=Lobosporangium transversale TaxID=64571 RepID=A0A1Y2GD59_9FUNG|nr:hypothetical protein BCR41DRAFT_399671 [Lobosporangium transversale]KAF9896668.1 hypothetical protein BX616_006984 [Lobosporangium transversale]ORZ07527.1 hypothetical protein BCR41DRAFT_399671 [Lobosporangium transversale]|eukprot:XP_021878034.1 hypothetical protein BCR41DRAFT_399671 [Lobosporangium transversale]
MSQNQFHHYIPRFILKNFSDNFQLRPSYIFSPNASGSFVQEPFPTNGPVGGTNKRGNKKTRRKKSIGSNIRNGGKGDREDGQEIEKQASDKDFPINVYRTLEETITLNDISRIYGIQNMYKDIAEEDSMKFEKLLGKLESTSAQFVHKIRSGEELTLTRTQLTEFKKFLAIMTYRVEHRRDQYYECKFDARTLLSLRKHMLHNNIDRVQDVWFENLKWIIKTSHEEFIEEYHKTHDQGNPYGISSSYKGPIHVLELLDYFHTIYSYVCVWQAEEGSEFILSNNCFGTFEGDNGLIFQHFYVVSPKYAVVLTNRMYMWGNTMKDMTIRESWFGDELRLFPETVYFKKSVKSPEDYDPKDVFKYQRLVASKENVHFCNSILLDTKPKYITYKSNLCMYKTLRYYDKAKKHLSHSFPNGHSYLTLKREVFAKLKAEMNRTHRS